MKAGTIVWVGLDPTVGHEQRGHRPALVISEPIRSLVIVVPLTSARPRIRAHHRMAGEKVSTALCEQVRSIDVERVTGVMGQAQASDLAEVRWIVGTIIGLG